LHLSLGEFSVDGARLVDEACPVGKNHSVSRARPINGARVVGGIHILYIIRVPQVPMKFFDVYNHYKYYRRNLGT